MDNLRFLLAAAPEQLPRAMRWNATPVHLAYRADGEGRLLRPDTAHSVRGGLMFLPGPPPLRASQGARLCRALLQECVRAESAGLVIDADPRTPGVGEFLALLEQGLTHSGRTLYLPEVFAEAFPRCRVLVCSALSGGDLRSRLELAVLRWGADRAVLAVEPAAEQFSLPCPSGCGTPLEAQELEQLRRRLQPRVFFSPDLCAHYFTFLSPQQEPCFVLFDDRNSLRRKVELARQAGWREVLLPWQAISDFPAHLGLCPTSPAEEKM